MPARAVQYHDNDLVRMPLRNFGQKHAQGFRIGPGQYQGVSSAVVRTDRHECILVFTYYLHRDFRPYADGSPAPARVTAAPEAGFVLKQQAHG